MTTNSNAKHSVSEPTYRPGDQLRPVIGVGRESLPIAIKHGMELWWDESSPTKRLDNRAGSSQFTRFVNGRIEGKLAEVAFTDLLSSHFNVDACVDWRIYGEYDVTDEGDLHYLLDDEGEQYPPGVHFDIKKTKPWNSWLAVRKEIFDKIDDEAPVVLSKMRIADDIQLDEWESTNSWEEVDQDDQFRSRVLDFADAMFPIDVEFVGSAYPHEFEDSFAKGDRLYDPVSGSRIGPELKRPNEGIFVENLNSTPERWNRIVSEICSEMPRNSWRPLAITDK